jgi:hypothetical protein
MIRDFQSNFLKILVLVPDAAPVELSPLARTASENAKDGCCEFVLRCQFWGL